jgi:hypothetical protein
MTRRLGAIAFLIGLTAASAGVVDATSTGGGTEAAATAATSEGAAPAARKEPLRYAEHDLFIETNATDRDAGLQMQLDGEDWRWLKLRDPRGRLVLELQARGRLRRFGLTELFFEAAEPSFDEVPFRVFRKRFPRGTYTFRGRTVEGRGLVGSDRLSHLVPAGPRVTFPTKGAVVDPNGFTVTWEPVTTPAGVRIVRYIVVVTRGERDLSMDLPSSARSASIPAEFLRPDLKPGAESKVEVLARERSGNQTIAEVEFRTR